MKGGEKMRRLKGLLFIMAVLSLGCLMNTQVSAQTNAATRRQEVVSEKKIQLERDVEEHSFDERGKQAFTNDKKRKQAFTNVETRQEEKREEVRKEKKEFFSIKRFRKNVKFITKIVNTYEQKRMKKIDHMYTKLTRLIANESKQNRNRRDRLKGNNQLDKANQQCDRSIIHNINKKKDSLKTIKRVIKAYFVVDKNKMFVIGRQSIF